MANDSNKKERELTRPRSPVLQTTQRMKIKDEFILASADKAKEYCHCESEFKARPFNKKIFESMSKLPSVERKNQTGFSEFQLS